MRHNFHSRYLPGLTIWFLLFLRGITAPLAMHLESQSVEFMQFAFRWMNCLLMREISVENTIRMWDTYLVRLTVTFRV